VDLRSLLKLMRFGGARGRRSLSGDHNCCEQSLKRIDGSGGEKTTEAVVDGLLKVLFAAKVTFRGQNGGVTKEKLDLLEFSSVHMTQLRAGATQIMRSDLF
jgi:hypothetical protein